MHLEFRKAKENDIAILVAMLADDELDTNREALSTPLNQRYIDAFQNIDQDSNNELIVAEHNGDLVGLLQLAFIPVLTHMGA